MTNEQTGRRRRWPAWAAAGAVAAYSLCHFREALFAFYFFDDFWVMRDAAQVRIRSVGDLLLFFRPGHMGFTMYRPLTTVFYSYVLQSLCGYDASAQHASQLVVFTANALLAFAITQRLTGSAVAATAAGLLYVVAPGQAIDAYWLSAFTVTGTTFWLLVMMACWVFTAGSRRLVLCTAAQILGLASSEHAITGPALLAILAAMRRESPRAALAAITPPAVLVGTYLSIKFYYIFFLRPPVVAIVLSNYGLTFDVAIWLEHLGAYFVQCFTPLALWDPSPRSALFLGCALAIALAAATWRAYRADGPWVLVAGGIAVFIASLAAVFPQRTHFGSPYICTAVLGAAWLIIGLCHLISREGRWLALTFSIAIVIVDSGTGGRAWRRPRVFRLVVDGSLAAERWVATARHGAKAGYDDILIPEDPVTRSVFRMGQLETFFPGMPSRVTLYDPAKHPKPQIGGAVFREPVPLTTPYQFPGAERHWDWLRRLVASPGRRMHLGADHQFVAEDSSD